MGDRSQCEVCKYAKAKNKFFGGKKLICSIQNHEVKELGACPKFVRDEDKVLQQARFRPHEYGSSDGCDTCAHRESTHGKSGTIYVCKKNDVQFWPGFSPMKYICDKWEDGDMDALVGYMADLLIEEDRLKKGGK